MREHIHDAARRLVRRQGAGELRVQNREYGADEIGAYAALELSAIGGDHRVGRSFASRRRDGEHRADRQRLRDGTPDDVIEKLPEIARIKRADGDGLGHVDHAAAADGKHEVQSVLTAKGNALVHKIALRVRLYAAEHDGLNAALLQRRRYLLEKSRAHGAAAAV